MNEKRKSSHHSLLFNEYCSTRVSLSYPTHGVHHYDNPTNAPSQQQHQQMDDDASQFQKDNQVPEISVTHKNIGNGDYLKTPQQTKTSAHKKQLSFSDNTNDDNSSSKQQHHLSVRFPMAGSHQRMLAPRLSLLGKPIYLSPHKSYQRNTPSMRWKMRLKTFLEQPQGFFPWLYHFSL